MTATRTAVIGVGHHGKHHARILSQQPDCELVAVCDPNETNRQAIANTYGCQAVADFRDLFGNVDAVVVATPTVTHFPIASEFLRRGVATLVEKPLAFSVEEASELTRLSRKHSTVLQVGHIERFNPAFQHVEAICEDPTFLEFRRYSRYPFRSLDVSVVFDVMIHDIDLALALVDSDVEGVDAVGACVVSPSLDRVDARLRFANGSIALLSGERTHFEPIRRIRAWNRSTSIEADLHRRVVQTTTKTAWADNSYSPTLTMEEKTSLWNELLPVESYQDQTGVEPLRLELEDFVANVRNGREPRVSGEAGTKAVALASRIESLVGGSGNLAIRRAA